MTLVILALASVAFALWRIQRATPPARRVPVPSTEGATGHNQHCSVRSCDEAVVVQIHAGHDYYPMCMGHGLPFLLEELPA